MNHIRRICRSLSGLPRRAGLLIATAAPAVLWADPPLPPGWNKYLYLPTLRFPPGWNKHSPPPAHARTVVIGGLPGWHTSLIVVMAAVLAAAVVVILTRPRQLHAVSPAPPPEPPPTDMTSGATPSAARPRR